MLRCAIPHSNASLPLSYGERCGEGRDSRMGEQAIYVIRIVRNLRVIPVLCMTGAAQDAGRQRRGYFARYGAE